MAAQPLTAVVQYLHRSLDSSHASHSDGELLARFSVDRDPASFEELVLRHERMVMNVCRHLLGNGADADDEEAAEADGEQHRARLVAGAVEVHRGVPQHERSRPPERTCQAHEQPRSPEQHERDPDDRSLRLAVFGHKPVIVDPDGDCLVVEESAVPESGDRHDRSVTQFVPLLLRLDLAEVVIGDHRLDGRLGVVAQDCLACADERERHAIAPRGLRQRGAKEKGRAVGGTGGPSVTAAGWGEPADVDPLTSCR